MNQLARKASLRRRRQLVKNIDRPEKRDLAKKTQTWSQFVRNFNFSISNFSWPSDAFFPSVGMTKWNFFGKTNLFAQVTRFIELNKSAASAELTLKRSDVFDWRQCGEVKRTHYDLI